MELKHTSLAATAAVGMIAPAARAAVKPEDPPVLEQGVRPFTGGAELAI